MPLTPEQARELLETDEANVVEMVGAGQPLPERLRLRLQKIAAIAGAPVTAATQPAASTAPDPPAAPDPEPTPFLLTDHHTKLTTTERQRFEALYRKGWRTIYRWIQTGEEKADPCPLHDPSRMPAWWSRCMKWRVPEEIERAAIDHAKQNAAPAAREPTPAAASAPELTAKNIHLEDFDPDEGDRLRELKQLQRAKFQEFTEALAAGADTTRLQDKYVALCETVDKIESRVTERLKKRGLYLLRDEVERDLAGNAELLRQTRESMERRVLEQCPSLSADQRLEVASAISLARRREDTILSKLDCLKTDDLLKELAA